jgi:hypothetical protein
MISLYSTTTIQGSQKFQLNLQGKNQGLSTGALKTESFKLFNADNSVTTAFTCSLVAKLVEPFYCPSRIQLKNRVSCKKQFLDRF